MAKNVTEEARLQFLAQIATLTNRRKWNREKLQQLMKDPDFGDLVAGFINNYNPVTLEAPPAEPTAKFAELMDLGIVTVPKDYVHGNRLDWFKTTYQNETLKSFYSYNDAITDANFPHPSRILKPGDRLHVRAFKQVVGGKTTSAERMVFLVEQKADVYTGAQGASLVWEQKREQLPKGFLYASFDKEENLWKDTDGRHRVPLVNAYSDDDFSFLLGYFESVWCGDDAFLGFCDAEE